MTREPRSESLLAARIQKAFPALSAYSAATLAEELCRIERAQRRHAERCCNVPDYDTENDGDPAHRTDERIARRVFRWRQRIGEMLNPCNPGETCVRTDLHVKRDYDPRGAVLLLQLPGETEASTV